MNDTLSADAASYWTVRCTPGGALCNQDQPFVVIVTGSYDVVLRYADADAAGDGDVARVSVKDSSPHNVLTQMMMIDGLPVLELLATKDDLDVVLLRKERVQRVVNQGSGDLTVHEDVLVSSGSSLTIAAVGSGDLYLKSFTSLTVDELSLESQGSGRLQASFSDFDVKSLSMKVISSGDVTALAAAKGTASLFTLSVEGSGALCLSSGSSLESDQLVIDKIGSGDISLGPRGSCQNAEISTKGSGTIDAGGIQCHNVNVDQLGSADIVVQATGSLSGDVYGRGHLKYYGAAPHSIDNVNYMGLVTADPASSSYHPSGCKAKAFPHLKATADTVGSSAGVAGQSAGEDFSYDLAIDQSNILYLAGVVFLVALVLRWFNESRRRAREEQRQPLVGASRRVYV
ncbi:hypothetical protein KRP22_006923 [Phytophthora ramorum]|nr:hypothetical protein KRP22_15347 [Phytophthora ramorum]